MLCSNISEETLSNNKFNHCELFGFLLFKQFNIFFFILSIICFETFLAISFLPYSKQFNEEAFQRIYNQKGR